jgi:hypothetical protein
MVTAFQLKSARHRSAAVETLVSSIEQEGAPVQHMPVVLSNLVSDMDSRIIGTKETAELIADFFPTYVDVFRATLEDKAGMGRGTSTELTGSMSSALFSSRAYNTLVALNARTKRIGNPEDTAFYNSFGSYLNSSGILNEDGIRGAVYSERKRSHGDYVHAKVQYSGDGKTDVAQKTDIVISGSDSSVGSLRAAYRILKKLKDKGLLRDDIKIDEDTFVARFQMDTKEKAAALGFYEEITPLNSDTPLLPLGDVRVSENDDSYIRISKIVKLASMFGLGDKTVFQREMLEKIYNNTAPANEYNHIPFVDAPTRLTPSEVRGQNIIDQLHNFLFEAYVKQSQGLKNRVIGNRQGQAVGIRGELSHIGEDHKDDAFQLVIPALSISPEAMELILKNEQQQVANVEIGGVVPSADLRKRSFADLRPKNPDGPQDHGGVGGPGY